MVWIAPTSPRGLAVWTACLFSHALLWSVRFALLDGPSLVLIALAVAAAERGRSLLSAGIVGVAGLGAGERLAAGALGSRAGRAVHRTRAVPVFAGGTCSAGGVSRRPPRVRPALVACRGRVRRDDGLPAPHARGSTDRRNHARDA